MTIDFMLILAIPTLVGLYVLYKTVGLHRHPPQVEVLRRTMYVCPFCQRTFMEQLSAQGCSCRTDPMSGDDSPFSPELHQQIEEVARMGDVLNESLHAHLDNRAMNRDVIQHFSNRNGIRELTHEINLGDAQRIVVVEGPISQPQLEALREAVNPEVERYNENKDRLVQEITALKKLRDSKVEDNRRLELS